MKILLASMSMDIGGAETHIVELAKGLVAAGHQVHVVSEGGIFADELVSIGKHTASTILRAFADLADGIYKE